MRLFLQLPPLTHMAVHPACSAPLVTSIQYGVRPSAYVPNMTVERVRARGAALLSLLMLAGRAARASVEPGAPGVFYMSAGRLGAIAAVLTGVAGAVSGVRALRVGARDRAGDARRGHSAALVAGPIAVALGGLVAATAPGGVGTGNGLGGAVVGIAFGLSATILGILASLRARQRSP
jgi:hypothetical protein